MSVVGSCLLLQAIVNIAGQRQAAAWLSPFLREIIHPFLAEARARGFASLTFVRLTSVMPINEGSELACQFGEVLKL